MQNSLQDDYSLGWVHTCTEYIWDAIRCMQNLLPSIQLFSRISKEYSARQCAAFFLLCGTSYKIVRCCLTHRHAKLLHVDAVHAYIVLPGEAAAEVVPGRCPENGHGVPEKDKQADTTYTHAADPHRYRNYLL